MIFKLVFQGVDNALTTASTLQAQTSSRLFWTTRKILSGKKHRFPNPSCNKSTLLTAQCVGYERLATQREETRESIATGAFPENPSASFFSFVV
jgi:hypothetical protein